MKYFLLNIILALAWAALVGSFSPINLLAGFVFGYIALWFMQFVLSESRYFGKVWQVISFVLYFLWELLKSNLKMAYYVIAPLPKMKPGVIAIPLDITTDIQITLLANMITLTPGTLSLDVSTDRTVIYVHSVYVTNPAEFRDSIKSGFEKAILEVTQ
jgi:multicomponent Na+:H+ antiporter subunit E